MTKKRLHELKKIYTPKWTKATTGDECELMGFRISRSKLHNGSHLYWVHWFENPHYAAHHSKMSESFKSLQAAKRFIGNLMMNPKAFSLNGLKKVKEELKAIDDKHHNEYNDAWHAEHDEYCKQFRTEE